MSKANSGAAWWKPTDAPTELLDLTMGQMLDQVALTKSDRPAVLVDEKGGARQTAWTYHELARAANEVGRGLMAEGVEPGAHVAVMAQNCAEWVLLEYALSKIGAVLVTVNPALLASELAYLLEQGRVEALIFTPRFRSNDIDGHLRSLLPDLGAVAKGHLPQGSRAFPHLKTLIAIGDDTPAYAMSFDALRAKAVEVSETALAERQEAVRPDDVAQIQYTSGTTGKPKGAMLTHKSTLNNARLMAQRGGFREDDILMSAMPLFHTAGCVCNVMAMLTCGGQLITMDAFDPQRMLELWHSHRPTIINAVPTMMMRVLEHPQVGDYDIATLRIAFTGGTSIPPALMKRMRDRTGGEPMIIMGMTECSPIITQTRNEDDLDTRCSTAGTPLPNTEIRIVDPETGETCEWGESGELCIRGYLTMAGYFDMPDKTAETIDSDGWLHSGDLAELDETGHLRIVGRLKDMIIRGGENVFPVEIENHLLSHDDISDVQVVGVNDPDLGEEICAVVVPVQGATVDPAGLQAFCREGMARHKMPKYIVVAESLPMTANGKPQKFALRDQANADIASGKLRPVAR